MENHFFKRLLTVIITFMVVFSLSVFFVLGTSGYASIARLYQTFYFILFMIVLVVLGLVLDSIILYRKQEKGKAKASLLVLAIFLFIIFLIFIVLLKIG
jgi:hypothetical protein